MTASRNNKFLCESALALLFLAPLLPKTKSMSPSAIFERESRYVATIRTFDSQGRPLGQGSGVVILAEPSTHTEKVGSTSNPGYVVIATNLHVLRGACDVSVQLSGGASGPVLRIAGPDSDNDIVLLMVRDEVGTYRRENMESAHLKPGDPVYAIGNPMGVGLSITEGVVSGIRDTLTGRRIQISAPISPGSSGGGLYDRFGRLAGITTSSLEGAQNLNFAIPIEAALDFERIKAGPEHEWNEARSLFCGSHSGVPTLDELRVVLGMHVASPYVRDFFAKLGGGQIPEPRRGESSSLPGDLATLGDHTGYWFSSLGLRYLAQDGILQYLVLFGPGVIEGTDTYYSGDLPFGLRWGMSGDEVREKFGSRWRNDDEMYEVDPQNLALGGRRGNFSYAMLVVEGRLVLVAIGLPVP